MRDSVENAPPVTQAAGIAQSRDGRDFRAMSS